MCYIFVPYHLRNKFDKKAIRCIFIGDDSEREGWRCCDPITCRCHISRNIVFDEATSWWSPQRATVPNSKDIEEKMQERLGKQVERELSDPAAQKVIPLDIEMNQWLSQRELDRQASPWRTDVYQGPQRFSQTRKMKLEKEVL